MAENVLKTPEVGYFYIMTRKVDDYPFSGPCSSRSGKRNDHTRFGHTSTSVKMMLRYLYS